MSESLPPEKKARDRAFGIACWTLGALAFVLLLMVGVSFSLTARTVVVEKVVETPVPVPVQQNPEGPAAVEEGDEPDTAGIAAVPAGSSEKPRSVEEMLRAADLSDPAGDPVPAAVAAPVPGGEGVSGQSPLPAENPAEAMPPMTEEVAELVKAARYAQIDGDLKVAVVKLEQAMRLEPDNPVVLYYYGLTYEWLRNADKSREFFLKVYTQREKAGKYFARAAQHLQRLQQHRQAFLPWATAFEARFDREQRERRGAVHQHLGYRAHLVGQRGRPGLLRRFGGDHCGGCVFISQIGLWRFLVVRK